MNNRVVLGMYVPTNSRFHSLDPRAKLLVVCWYVVLVFLATSLVENLWLTLVLVLMIVVTKVPFRMYWHGLKPMAWVIAFTVVVQLLFSSGGVTYWHWGPFHLTSGGVADAGLVFARFTLVILASTVLTVATPPLQLADAVESIMKPLKIFHVPVGQVSLMLSIAMRFIPTIFDEVATIMNAQRARGANFDEGSLWQRAKRFVSVLIPLFVASFQRAEELAVAMDARDYDPNGKRTKYRLLRWQKRDWAAVMLMVAVTVIFLACRSLTTVSNR